MFTPLVGSPQKLLQGGEPPSGDPQNEEGALQVRVLLVPLCPSLTQLHQLCVAPFSCLSSLLRDSRRVLFSSSFNPI